MFAELPARAITTVAYYGCVRRHGPPVIEVFAASVEPPRAALMEESGSQLITYPCAEVHDRPRCATDATQTKPTSLILP